MTRPTPSPLETVPTYVSRTDDWLERLRGQSPSMLKSVIETAARLLDRPEWACGEMMIVGTQQEVPIERIWQRDEDAPTLSKEALLSLVAATSLGLPPSSALVVTPCPEPQPADQRLPVCGDLMVLQGFVGLRAALMAGMPYVEVVVAPWQGEYVAALRYVVGRVAEQPLSRLERGKLILRIHKAHAADRATGTVRMAPLPPARRLGALLGLSPRQAGLWLRLAVQPAPRIQMVLERSLTLRQATVLQKTAGAIALSEVTEVATERHLPR